MSAFPLLWARPSSVVRHQDESGEDHRSWRDRMWVIVRRRSEGSIPGLLDMNFTERFIPRDQYRIYAREYAGGEPAIILMHGFPDNLHLYDRLVPYLASSRRLITFDFL